jgi:hypothetical protein
MSADVFVRFLERKLSRSMVLKGCPGQRRVGAEADAASVSLPSDLHHQVVAALKRQSDTPWDIAVAEIVRREVNGNDKA